MKFPLAVKKGRKRQYVKITYQRTASLIFEPNWGSCISDNIFSLGERFISNRHISREKTLDLALGVHNYTFIDFHLKGTSDKYEPDQKRVLALTLDVSDELLAKGATPLVLLDSRGGLDYIFGIGTLDFKNKVADIDFLSNFPIIPLSFAR